MTRIVSVPVAAGAYKGRIDTTLTHAAEVDDRGNIIKAFCRVNVASLLDDSTMFDRKPVDCPICMKKMERVK